MALTDIDEKLLSGDEIIEAPDDFFIAGDLDYLRSVRASVAITDDEVVIAEFL